MSEKSKIEWTDDTWNPWRGCVKVSPGCKNCYAEVSTPVRVARSEGRELWGGTLRDRAKEPNAPLKWNKNPCICNLCGEAFNIAEGFHKHGTVIAAWHRRRVFSLSLGDWLDEAVPIEWLADMLDVIRRCSNLDFLLLTKRPENWEKRIDQIIAGLFSVKGEGDRALENWLVDWTDGNSPTNVWIGCTVENQEYADKRIPELLKIPAGCRFLSVEPMLGPINFDPHWLGAGGRSGDNYQQSQIHWPILGFESGPKARGGEIGWIRNAMVQFKAAGLPVFVKQLGAKPYVIAPGPFWNREILSHKTSDSAWIHLEDKKGGDMAEWPEDLRVREFPTT